MNKILILLTFLILQSQSKCRNIHSGHFIDLIDNNEEIQIFRSDSIQIHTEPSGLKSKYTIEWSDDCNYKMKLTGISLNGNKFSKLSESAKEGLEDLFIQVQIIEVEKDHIVEQKKFFNGDEFEEITIDTIMRRID